MSTSSKICLNCEQGLADSDKFCPNCGQDTKLVRIPFKDVIIDWLAANFNFDTKLWNSLKMMVLKPGQISVDYNNGKRERYVLPLKFFLFVSLIYFLAQAPLINSTKKDLLPVRFSDSITFLDLTFRNVSDFEKFQDATDQQLDSMAGKKLSPLKHFMLRRFSKLYLIDKASFIQSTAKTSLFFLMPGFALILMLFYRKHKKYFIETLIFSVHFHSAIFLLLTLLDLAEYIYSKTPSITVPATMLYLFFSLKNFYLESTRKTIAKTLLLVVAHGFLLCIAIVVSALVTALIL